MTSCMILSERAYDMSVQKIMSKRIVTVELDDTLAVARDIFENVNFITCWW